MSLAQKTTTQSIIVSKLSSYARRNKTQRALWEYDAILRTLYLLDYIDSPPLRRNVQHALNRGENYHQLRRAISYANFGKLRFRSEEDQQIWNECSRLLANCIIYVNATILSELWTHKVTVGDTAGAEALKQISPVAWQHVNFHGRYEFTKRPQPIDLPVIIDAFMALDVARLWGDGSKVGADGNQIDTWDDNLLAETSIRYGGYGGIADRHIADTYIALFSHFIPCGVWEAVYIFEGLLANASKMITSEEIHADTQGQSLPAFGLATLLGVELLPRIRNWKDLIFYRPTSSTRYRHIDALFGDNDVIDWKLIETHWIDLMRVVISIREGRISSSALLRRLTNESRKNRICKAFRELGRAIRTIVLLRYLSEPELRESITTITNRVESFHNFSKWLSFGNAGIIADNDPEHMEKVVKFNELLANCVIFYNAAELTAVLNQLCVEGNQLRSEDVAALSPYTTNHILRFGDYVLDLSPPRTAVNTHLDLSTEASALQLPTKE